MLWETSARRSVVFPSTACADAACHSSTGHALAAGSWSFSADYSRSRHRLKLHSGLTRHPGGSFTLTGLPGFLHLSMAMLLTTALTGAFWPLRSLRKSEL